MLLFLILSRPLHPSILHCVFIIIPVHFTNTCPNIAFATQQLSQFMIAPTHSHFPTALRVVHYLRSCPRKGLFFSRSSSLHLLGFNNADWATCVHIHRSTTGYCFFIGSSLISWKTKKQSTISRSSVDVEYRALESTTCELQRLIYLLCDLHISCGNCPVLYCDNQSALHIVANPVFHEMTKHLEIDCHIVRINSLLV